MHEKPKKWKFILVGLVAGMLLGGTIAVTTPSVAAGPAKIWKQIKKKADNRYYTKKKSDKRFVPKPKVIRGAFALSAAPSGNLSWNAINFGVTLAAAPVAHIIGSGAPVPSGCSGTAANPSASPGHLCIFEFQITGMDNRFVCSAVDECLNKSSKFGAHYGAYTTSDNSQGWGSWAVGVGAVSTTARLAPAGASTDVGGPGGT